MKTLSDLSNFPQFKLSFQEDLTLESVTVITKDFKDDRVVVKKKIRGFLNPQKPAEVNFKKDGQRDWKWFNLYTKKEAGVKNLDFIVRRKNRFKVLKTLDYSNNGFMKYEVVENYEGAEVL